MGPELLLSIAGPVVAGLFSLVIFLAKKNNEVINKGFDRISGSVSLVSERVNEIDHKVESLRINVAENYATKDELRQSFENEEKWHQKTDDEFRVMREELKDSRTRNYEFSERVRNDLNEIKEMQWKTRMNFLDIADKARTIPQYPKVEEEQE